MDVLNQNHHGFRVHTVISDDTREGTKYQIKSLVITSPWSILAVWVRPIFTKEVTCQFLCFERQEGCLRERLRKGTGWVRELARQVTRAQRGPGAGSSTQAAAERGTEAEAPKRSGVGKMESTGFRHGRSCRGRRSCYEEVTVLLFLSVTLLRSKWPAAACWCCLFYCSARIRRLLSWESTEHSLQFLIVLQEFEVSQV